MRDALLLVCDCWVLVSYGLVVKPLVANAILIAWVYWNSRVYSV